MRAPDDSNAVGAGDALLQCEVEGGQVVSHVLGANAPRERLQGLLAKASGPPAEKRMGVDEMSVWKERTASSSCGSTKRQRTRNLWEGSPLL